MDAEINFTIRENPRNMPPLLSDVLKELQSLRAYIVRSNEECRMAVAQLNNEVNSLREEIALYKRQSIDSFLEEDAESLLPKLPLGTSDDLEAFESSISDSKETKEQLRTLLLNIEAPDMPSFLRKSLRKLITDDLAVKFSYFGTKEKPKIQHYNFIAMLKETADFRFEGSNPKRIDKIIQLFFIYAMGRILKRKQSRKEN